MTCDFHCAIVTKPYVAAGSFLNVDNETVFFRSFPIKKIFVGQFRQISRYLDFPEGSFEIFLAHSLPFFFS